MSHYFINDPNLNKDLLSFEVNLRGKDFTFYTQAGVFSKNYLDYGSKLLIESIEIKEEHKTIIDVGCGYGPIGLSLAKNNDIQVHMYDINERAIDLSVFNASKNNIENIVIKKNDLLDNVDVFADLIVTNPPIRAGKKTVFKLYEQSYDRLNENGELYIVIQRKQGAPSTLNKIDELFGNSKVIKKSKGYWIIYGRKTSKS